MEHNNLVLIAGGTASGKTFIAKKVAENIARTGKEVSFLSIDNYYKPLSEFGGLDNNDVNWDHPDTILWTELKSDIAKLKDGQTITRNVYNFNISDYTDEVVEIKPSEYIILEGLFALYDEDIVGMAEAKFFVQADSDVRLIRRIRRDESDRYSEFNIQPFIDRWEASIKPMHDKYIAPQQHRASIVFKNNIKDNEGDSDAINMITNLLV